MLPSISIYYSSSKYQIPLQSILEVNKNLTISENDYVYIEVQSLVLLSNNCYLWLSDFKFGLTFIEHNVFGYFYSINLNTFFEPEDTIKFSHRFTKKDSSNHFYKIFLNYYGECTIEIEGLNDDGSFLEVGKINVESDKILEIDNLLDYLLAKDHYYWNTVSLTKVEASDKLKEEENIIWTLKKLESSINIFDKKILPYLSDSIGRLVPVYNVNTFNDTSVITEESLLWLLENCNILEPSNIYENDSFLVLNRPFKINELLSQSLHLETDIVENQVIHGYINDVFTFLTISLNSIEKFTSNINGQQDFKTQIFKSYYQRLGESIVLLKNKTLNIKNILSSKIPVSREHLNLSGSNRFYSKQHYHEAYIQISNWITRNEAVFSKEELFSGAKDISKLYEIYCLFKIIDTLSNEFDYVLDSSSKEQIEVEDIYDILSSKRNNLKSQYNFIKLDRTERITLFYELLPNKLTTVARGISRGYRPDFVLEIEKENTEVKYIILDSKYKKIGTIQNYDYQELSLKYIHGIGLKAGGYFPLLGLFILNPIDNSQISYYQKKEFSNIRNQVSLPLIGRVEMSISPNSHNYFKDLINNLISL